MTYIMKAADFNRMHAAARDLIDRYHAGAEFAPETVRWAQDLIVSNPTPKRTPPRSLDQVAELFTTPELRASGMTIVQFAELAPHLNAGKSETMKGGSLQKLLRRLCKSGEIFMLQRKRVLSLYFLTAAERDKIRLSKDRAKREEREQKTLARQEIARLRGVRAELLAKAKMAREEANAMVIPRRAKTPLPREHVKRDLDPGRVDSLAAKVLKRPTKAQQIPAKLFNPKTPKAPPPASGSVFIPAPARVPSPTIDPNDPRIQRAATPKGRFEVTEADLKIRIFGGTAPGTNPLTGRPW